MNAYLVTEGQTNVALLTRLLSKEVGGGLHIVSASGRSGAQSLARSIVAARRRPVALVLDAETTHESLVDEQRLVTRELLAMASPGVPTDVFMAVPNIEVLFFCDKGLLERLVGTSVRDELWRAGRFQPKGTLERILKESRTTARNLSDLLGGLTGADAALMSQQPPISEIREFLRTRTKAPAAAIEG